MKPVIALTPSITEDEKLIQIKKAYCDALEHSGALSVIMNYNTSGTMQQNIEYILELANGVMFIGGVDIDPRRFGQEPAVGLGEISPIRDEFETALLIAAVKRQKPVLAICRGIQLLSVALGGTVIQDINSATLRHTNSAPLKHMQSAPGYYGSHGVTISKGTQLHNIVGKDYIYVNSFHHQSVDCLPEGFIISALSSDGIIEAIEPSPDSKMAFMLGLQWHPELMYEKSDEQFAIFNAFVNVCRKA